MSDLKTMGYKLNLPEIQRTFSRIKDSMERLAAYSKSDVVWLEMVYEQLHNLPDAKPEKTHAGNRTRSYRWRAGTKKGKPKHNWSKKKRVRMGWKV